MAEAEIMRHAETAMSRWPLMGLTVIHRVGRINPGENIVLVLTASQHRQAAFQAAEFLMDYLEGQRAVLEARGKRRRDQLGRCAPSRRRRSGALDKILMAKRAKPRAKPPAPPAPRRNFRRWHPASW